MKLDPLNFMETLGDVKEEYVEEMLDCKDGRRLIEHRRPRWSPLPAIGVLSGAAVCAAMAFGIWSVAHPDTTVTTSGVGTQLVEQNAGADPSEYYLPATDRTQNDFLVQFSDIMPSGMNMTITNAFNDTDASLRALVYYITERGDSTYAPLTEVIPLIDHTLTLAPGESASIALIWDTALPDGVYNLRITDMDVTATSLHYNYPFTIDTGKKTDDRQQTADAENPDAETTEPAQTEETEQDTVETPDITAEIKGGTLTPAGCTVILKNHADTEFSYSICWSVSDAATGTPLTPNQPLVWNLPSEPYLLDGGDSRELTVNWQPYYGELLNGSYLLTFSSDDTATVITVPFTISGGQTTTVVTTATATDTTPAASTTVTTVTTYARPDDSGDPGDVYIIADFRLDMGYQPARLSEKESETIHALIDALNLTPLSEYEGSRRASELAGGYYYVETSDNTYKIWNEKLLYINGQWYTDDGDTIKALLDDVIWLIVKYQP